MLLEFLLGICFVRIDVLVFYFVYDCVVQLVSRFLFVVLTFRLSARLTSTYICVFVSVCDSGPPVTGLVCCISVTRPSVCDGSVFLFLPVYPAPFP